MFRIRALAFSSKSRPGPIALFEHQILICNIILYIIDLYSQLPFHVDQNHAHNLSWPCQLYLKQHWEVEHDEDLLGLRVWVASFVLLPLIDPVDCCLNNWRLPILVVPFTLWMMITRNNYEDLVYLDRCPSLLGLNFELVIVAAITAIWWSLLVISYNNCQYYHQTKPLLTAVI